MMALIDRKFYEEQLLLETFFPKMHIERDIHKKVITRELKPHKKATGGAGVLICYLGHHSRTFPAQKLLPAHFAIFFLICLEPKLQIKLSIFNLQKKNETVERAAIFFACSGLFSV